MIFKLHNATPTALQTSLQQAGLPPTLVTLENHLSAFPQNFTRDVCSCSYLSESFNRTKMKNIVR